jgi:hypothetical protein
MTVPRDLCGLPSPCLCQEMKHNCPRRCGVRSNAGTIGCLLKRLQTMMARWQYPPSLIGSMTHLNRHISAVLVTIEADFKREHGFFEGGSDA